MRLFKILGTIYGQYSIRTLFPIVKSEFTDATHGPYAIRLMCSVDFELQYEGNFDDKEPFNIEGSCFVMVSDNVISETRRFHKLMKDNGIIHEVWVEDDAGCELESLEFKSP